jgi:hypothetical protein
MLYALECHFTSSKRHFKDYPEDRSRDAIFHERQEHPCRDVGKTKFVERKPGDQKGESPYGLRPSLSPETEWIAGEEPHPMYASKGEEGQDIAPKITNNVLLLREHVESC